MPKKSSKFRNYNYRLLFYIHFYMYLIEDRERKKKAMIKRKEDDHVAKDHLKDLLQTLESVWENKRVVVNVDNFKNCFYFINLYVKSNLEIIINKIQVILYVYYTTYQLIYYSVI
jgi:hypothetical protein